MVYRICSFSREFTCGYISVCCAGYGLSEAETGALIFDKPEGRIVSIEALAAIPSADIFAFYRLSLPNLGWQIKPELAVRNSETFHREDEALTIKYEGGVVFFRLQPIAGN